MIHVYTGEGKGKTTASIGLGIRAIGANKKVLMVQFLKDGKSSEKEVIEEVDGFDVKSFGRTGVLKPGDFSNEDKKLVGLGFDFLEENAEKYDLIILDEINVAIHMNLIDVDKIISFLKRNSNKEIVLTGRNAKKEIIEIADLVTDLKEVKHYFRSGTPARKGIEF